MIGQSRLSLKSIFTKHGNVAAMSAPRPSGHKEMDHDHDHWWMQSGKCTQKQTTWKDRILYSLTINVKLLIVDKSRRQILKTILQQLSGWILAVRRRWWPANSLKMNKSAQFGEFRNLEQPSVSLQHATRAGCDQTQQLMQKCNWRL